MSEETKEVVHILQSEVDKTLTRLHQLVNEVANQNLVIVKLTDKMEERKPCDLHVSTMEKLNETVNRIELSNGRTQGEVEGFIKLANNLLLKIENDIYKDGGLMTKTSNNKNQITLQWGIIGMLFAGGLGVGLYLWKH